MIACSGCTKSCSSTKDLAPRISDPDTDIVDATMQCEVLRDGLRISRARCSDDWESVDTAGFPKDWNVTPFDPWGHSFEWRCYDGKIRAVRSCGRDGMCVTGDDIHCNGSP